VPLPTPGEEVPSDEISSVSIRTNRRGCHDIRVLLQQPLLGLSASPVFQLLRGVFIPGRLPPTISRSEHGGPRLLRQPGDSTCYATSGPRRIPPGTLYPDHWQPDAAPRNIERCTSRYGAEPDADKKLTEER